MVFLQGWLMLWPLSAILVQSRRVEPTNPFPPPTLQKEDLSLGAIFEGLERKIQEATRSSSSPWPIDITSFSVAVTSASETLRTTSHTAPILGNYSDGSPSQMSDQTYFRIASISKAFTVLAVLLQEKAGNCSLRDSITRYVPELQENAGTGHIDWKAITLDVLASQLSGIPREYGQSDLTDPFMGRDYRFDNPVSIGLPPVDADDVTPCGSNRPGGRPCTRKGATLRCPVCPYARLTYHVEIINGFTKRPPVFQPSYKATYSNMPFVFLGFALENMTGLEYADVVQSTIFDPLGMERATLTKPSDTEGIIPNVTNDWAADIGTYGPTGGIYTTTSDLALFARSVLTNKLLDNATTNAWLKPRSYSSSWSFAYGMPWEIFRTSDMLSDSDRIQTIVTKAGGLRGYTSQLIMIPEYSLGLVVFVAGDGHALAWLREEILKSLIPAVEEISRSQTASRLSGSYVSSGATINSSLTLEVQGSSGLVVTSWISNGTDFHARYMDMSDRKHMPGKIQLTPAQVSRGDNSAVWRAQLVHEDLPSEGLVNTNFIVDVDTFTYASRSLEEFVFELDASGRATKVDLPAFQIVLDRQTSMRALNTFETRLQELMKPMGLMN
ncbi:MAG: hypothetical protein Q9172_001179 [Xanthocarpia lactea]